MYAFACIYLQAHVVFYKYICCLCVCVCVYNAFHLRLNERCQGRNICIDYRQHSGGDGEGGGGVAVNGGCAMWGVEGCVWKSLWIARKRMLL